MGRSSAATTAMGPPIVFWTAVIVVAIAMLELSRSSGIVPVAQGAYVTPARRFEGARSSPVFLLKGLRNATVDYVVGRIHDRKGGTAAAPAHVESERATVHELRDLILRSDRREGVRAIAVPNFELNRTATLRLAIWFPCADPPPAAQVATLAMPCFFEPLPVSDYSVTVWPRVDAGREALFYFRHHPALPLPQDLAGDAVAQGLYAIEWRGSALDYDDDGNDPETAPEEPFGQAVTPATPPPDHADGSDSVSSASSYEGPTTRATCWFPPTGALDQDALPIDVTRYSHRFEVRHLHAVRQIRGHTHHPRGGSEGEDDDAGATLRDDHSGSSYHHHHEYDGFGQAATADADPAAWYEAELTQDGPVDRDAATVGGQPYCRSWLIVSGRSGSGGIGGWTVRSRATSAMPRSGGPLWQK